MSFRPLLLGTTAAVVLAMGVALAGPASALGTDLDDLMELAQATPAPPPPAAGGDRRADRNFSPRAVCQDMVARRIGNRAYIKVKLDLKPEQMSAWTAFEKASDEASAKSMARCAAMPAEMKERPGYVERLTIEEEAMKARVASIEAVKPSLTALFAVLTPEQKATLDRPRGPMMGMARGHHGPGPR